MGFRCRACSIWFENGSQAKRRTHQTESEISNEGKPGCSGKTIKTSCWLCSLETVDAYPYKGAIFFFKKKLGLALKIFFLSSLFQSYGQFNCPKLLCNQLTVIQASTKIIVNSVCLPSKNSVTSAVSKNGLMSWLNKTIVSSLLRVSLIF